MCGGNSYSGIAGTPVAAVRNHRFGTAARIIDAGTPANLCQQMRGPGFETNVLSGIIVCWAARRTTLACYDFQLQLRSNQQSATKEASYSNR